MNKRTIAIARWIIAALLLSGSLFVLKRTLATAEPFGELTHLLFGFGALIAGAILLAPELAELAAIPVHHALAGIFWPGGSEVPPANYKLARKYREEWRYAEAIEQYRFIIRNHPQDLGAYVEGIETAFESGSAKLAEKLHRAGMRRLTSPEARGEVKRTFEILTERHSHIAR